MSKISAEISSKQSANIFFASSSVLFYKAVVTHSIASYLSIFIPNAGKYAV